MLELPDQDFKAGITKRLKEILSWNKWKYQWRNQSHEKIIKLKLSVVYFK